MTAGNMDNWLTLSLEPMNLICSEETAMPLHALLHYRG